MDLSQEIFSKITEEIKLDPMKVDYAGKTSTEIVKLLNNPVIKKKLVEVTETFPARINTILVNIANNPNVVSEEDLIGIG